VKEEAASAQSARERRPARPCPCNVVSNVLKGGASFVNVVSASRGSPVNRIIMTSKHLRARRTSCGSGEESSERFVT